MATRAESIERVNQLLAVWRAGHEPEFLDAAIDLLGQLIAADDAPELRAIRGEQLMTRHRRTGAPADLDAAVADFASAFAATASRGSSEVHVRGLDLAWAHETRFDLRGGRGERFVGIWDKVAGVELLNGPFDLVDAIYVLDGLLSQDGRANVPATGPAPPEVAWRQKRNLANLLLKYAAATESNRAPADRAQDQARAVELLRQAQREMPEDSAEAGTVISSLIVALEAAPDPDPAVSEQLVAGLERSIKAAPPAQVPILEFNLAELWRMQGRTQAAVDLYRELSSGRAAPAAVGVRLQAVDGWALWALHRGAWDEVVEAHGYAVAATAAVRAGAADWSDRYLWSLTSARVATFAAAALVRLGRPADAAGALQTGRALMLAERLGTEATSGSERPGTAVYLFSTPVGTDALGRSDGAEWTWSELPGLDTDRVLARVVPYADALDSYHQFPSSGLTGWLAELAQMIDFLRDGLLPFVRTLPPGEVTLVPVGFFAMLPLAAALLQSPPVHGVSCVPALTHRATADAVAPTQVMVVSDPGLTWAEWEGAAVSTFLTPVGPAPQDASPRTVLESLPAHGVVHFACHATMDLGAPLASCLELPAGKLTVGDVLNASLPPLALVVLSACETGLPDPGQLDEGIAFPAAFIASTGAGVVSTLWKVNDLSTSLLVMRFYWEWLREKASAPLALARAQWWQRSTSADEKCAFLTQAESAGVLTAAAAAAMATTIRQRVVAGTENPFAHPHHWAGLSFAS